MAKTTPNRPRGDGSSQTINPDMITLAREARGLSQKDLSARLEISSGHLSKIEAGLVPMSDSLLESLVDILAYPKSFFWQPNRVYGPSTSEFYHRKRRAASAREIARIHAEINIRMAQITKLLRSADLDAGEFPRCDPEEFEQSVSYVARAVRAGWGLPSGPVKSMVSVIEDAGGILIRFPFKTRLIDAVSRWVPGLPPMFFVNDGIPSDRERLTLAHEIGHLVMHQAVRPEIEDEANAFAAEFLMPEEAIRPQLNDLTLHKLASLKALWKVSMQALLKRASDLGTITRGKSDYLWMQISRLGYRLREPTELDPPREEAQTLQQLIDVHLGTFKYSLGQLAGVLNCFEPDLVTSYGLPALRASRGSRLRVVQ
jgi:Zn-dependent peptidase ImmA (M78 family)/transcriptional regulator with XRE-family HTH domain